MATTCIRASIVCSGRMPRAGRPSRWNEPRRRRRAYRDSSVNMGRTTSAIQKVTARMVRPHIVQVLSVVDGNRRRNRYDSIGPELEFIHRGPCHLPRAGLQNRLRQFMSRKKMGKRYTSACSISFCGGCLETIALFVNLDYLCYCVWLWTELD